MMRRQWIWKVSVIVLIFFFQTCNIMKLQMVPVNPLNPRNDEHETSPHNIHTLFSKQVMKIFELIR